jgi:hypothetical protein
MQFFFWGGGGHSVTHAQAQQSPTTHLLESTVTFILIFLSSKPLTVRIPTDFLSFHTPDPSLVIPQQTFIWVQGPSQNLSSHLLLASLLTISESHLFSSHLIDLKILNSQAFKVQRNEQTKHGNTDY